MTAVTLPHRHYPQRLIDAALALQDNRLSDAEPLLKRHLKADPFDVRAIRMLAERQLRSARRGLHRQRAELSRYQSCSVCGIRNYTVVSTPRTIGVRAGAKF